MDAVVAGFLGLGPQAVMASGLRPSGRPTFDRLTRETRRRAPLRPYVTGIAVQPGHAVRPSAVRPMTVHLSTVLPNPLPPALARLAAFFEVTEHR